MVDFFSNIAKLLLSMPRTTKKFFALGLDGILCVVCVWVSFFLRLGYFITPSVDASVLQGFFAAAVCSVLFAIPIFLKLGFYDSILRYSGLHVMPAVVKAFAVYLLIYALTFSVFGVSGVPRTVGLIQPIMFYVFFTASRTTIGMLFLNFLSEQQKGYDRKRFLIYGVGENSFRFVSNSSSNLTKSIVGFIDSKRSLQGGTMCSLPVWGVEKIDELVATHGVNEVLISTHDIDPKKRAEIIKIISESRVAIRLLPHIKDIIDGNVSYSDIRELDLEDLLGRKPVLPDATLLSHAVKNKVVLVTGAGGSIGGEISRIASRLNPERMLLVDSNEYALYQLCEELEKTLPNYNEVVTPLLVSVMDEQSIENIFSSYKPQCVFHAAAYKHVNLVENNVLAGVKNNVFGTLVVVKAATRYKCENFVLISSDKAVRPTSVMGSTKRVSELILQAYSAKKTATKFCMVRFGNVLGSSGSVIPKFYDQIKNDGPITVTDKNVTRYFMTVHEAANLVLQAAGLSKGGEVFLLDMGEAVKIDDLARRMVLLAGKTVRDNNNPEGDIELQYIGLKNGEKLFEELLISEEATATAHPKIFQANEKFVSIDLLEVSLQKIEAFVLKQDVEAVKSIIAKLIR